MNAKRFVVMIAVLSFGCEGVTTHPAAVVPLAEAACELAYRCCDRYEAAYFVGPHVTVEDCADRLIRNGELSPVLVVGSVAEDGTSFALPSLAALDLAIAEGRMAVDGTAHAECLEELRTVACNAPPEVVVPDDAPRCPVVVEDEEETDEVPACQRMFIGNVPEGGRCTSTLNSLECLDGLTCRTFEALGVYGECVRAGLHGDYCTADSDCGEDLYCARLDFSCQPYRTVGQTCAYADRDSLSPSVDTELLRCDPELQCDPITDTCAAVCERGHSCLSDDDCDATKSYLCIAGRCDTLRGAGLPCAETDDCVAGLRCGVPADAPPGTLALCFEQLSNGSDCFADDDCLSDFCNPTSGVCEDKVSAGSACPSGVDSQCADGSCEGAFTGCATDDECPGACDTAMFTCIPTCVALLADGQDCIANAECASDVCIDGTCVSPPLVDGEPCAADVHCESGFCSLELERSCATLPLALDARCATNAQCDSGLCYGPSFDTQRCINGGAVGDPCGVDLAPCNPLVGWCDTEEDPSVCVRLRETGEPCEREVECRGGCARRAARQLCGPAPPPDAAVCDGGEGGES